jgi:hypothetical protein
MAGALLSSADIQETLAQVVALAVATIEGCDVAGICLMGEDGCMLPAYTDAVVVRIDALQHHFVEGPALEAIAHRVPYWADDLGDDRRWRRFGPEAAAMGMLSMLALPLFTDGTIGAITLYGRGTAAFGADDRANGLLLAALAGLAFSSAQSQEDEERRTAYLHAALDTREVIGQAQGILMERERITADEAFDMLRRASQHLNLKLREVAQTLVDTGERPDTGHTSPR